MSIVARFVIRPEEKGSTKGSLIVGFTFKGQTQLVANRVYQIEEFLEETIIRDIGESCIPSHMDDNPAVGICWGADISSVIELAGKNLVLTADEFKNSQGELR